MALHEVTRAARCTQRSHGRTLTLLATLALITLGAVGCATRQPASESSALDRIHHDRILKMQERDHGMLARNP